MADQPLPTLQQEKEVTVVTFGSELESIDESLLPGLGNYLAEQSRIVQPAAMIFDMTKVQFFSSSFIELLFRVSNKLASRGGKFAICGLTPHCAEVLHVTNLDRLWKIYPNRQAALEGLASP
ncbi:MAG: STAS domain-containing protein [Planctomycetales bacterium]